MADAANDETVWIVYGTRPVIWSVPMRATAYGDSYIVELALHLRQAQVNVVERRLAEVGERVAGQWRVRRSELARIAEPVSSTDDLESLYCWHKPAAAPVSRFKDPEHQASQSRRNDFLDSLLAKVGGSRSELEVWWAIFCDHILDQLLNDEKPVDFFAFTLWPLPLRLNWQERLVNALSRSKVLPGRRPWQMRHHPAVARELANPRMLGLNRAGFIRRYVTVELSSDWQKASSLVERLRLEALGAEKYAAFTLNRLAGSIGDAQRIFYRWLVHSRSKSAVASPSGPDGEDVLVENLPPAFIGRELRRINACLVPAIVRKQAKRHAKARLKPRVRGCSVVATNGAGDLRGKDQKDPD